MDRSGKRILLAFVFGGLLCLGCSKTQTTYVTFAANMPKHLGDWEQLKSALIAEGIHCSGSPCDLGVCELLVRSDEFNKARRIAHEFIRNHGLTVRISKDVGGNVREVYEGGKWIRDEPWYKSTK
ncbi:MAG TPA: hypothetical protein VL171_06070 [Verrucomicrobiae bacterium]|nr:hypothetical protein [Verrucomicrobiae bacterium]